MEHLQYPIGRFLPKQQYSADEIKQLTLLMEAASEEYQELVGKLSAADLAKTYREGSWTVRQLVHHVADIHLLHFLRVKKTLTENDYAAELILMNEWAATPDAIIAPVKGSLAMLTGISERFVFLIRNLEEQDLNKTFYHPARKTQLSLKQALHMALRHITHHQAHIKLALGLQPHASKFS